MDKMLESLTRYPRVRAFLKRFTIHRNDELGREQGQAVVRVFLAAATLAYLVIGRLHVDFVGGAPTWLPYMIGFFVLSCAVAALTLRDKSSSVIRRSAMNVADVSAISYFMIQTGETGIPLFVLYLWITLGNGFRFGLAAMIASAAMSLAGFSLVVTLSPVWQRLTFVYGAVAAALILIPLYSARFIHQRSAAASKGANSGDTLPHSMASESAPSSLRQRIGAILKSIKLKRHDALGREQGQHVVRDVILTILFVYLVASHYPIPFDDGVPLWLTWLVSYFALSMIMTVLAYRDTDTSVIRRLIANIADVATISYLMIANGNVGIPFFVLYLWITLGNGFRFGLSPMLVSGGLSLIGFSSVIVFSPVWQELVSVSIAVAIALVVLPLYSAHLIRQLSMAMKRVEEANAAKSRFLARMSHELRTPLNGILGATELLAANKRLTSEDRSLIDVIRDSVRLSLRQIDNVLDFSKIEAGKLVIEQIPFDLHELLNRSIRLVRGIAHDKHLRLMLRIDPAVPSDLIGDPHYVQEVLLNLMSNAIKFTDKGYVSLDASLVSQDAQSATIRLSVHDTGIGIEPQALERIFEAFSQEDTSTTRRYGGTGLGTTIAKQLIDLMGGRIDVSSKKDFGSTFAAEVRFTKDTQEINHETSLAGMRVLLVTERAALRERMSMLAQNWGISLNTGASISEAVGLLKRGIRMGNPIHAALVDSSAVLADDGAHRGDDFIKKAWLSLTPTFLICDLSPGEAQLRKWGYAALLAYDLPRSELFAALHASGLHESESGRSVVRIEPWAWSGEPTRQRPRLLIADDNRTNLMILRKILETANFDVDTAEDGEQALDMLLRTRYKAAILDMHMPGLDGTAVIKQYRLLQQGARLPIIMLTANATVDAKVESAEAGADAYLTKPASASAIISTIEKLLDNTEVVDLTRRRPASQTTQTIPLLDTEIITELDRLYNDPIAIQQIVEEFEREGHRILNDLASAVSTKNHAGFCELLHALKGNGANVGAVRLAHACHEAGMYSLVDFRREGAQLLTSLRGEFAEAMNALREFTTLGGSGPAQGSDPH